MINPGFGYVTTRPKGFAPWRPRDATKDILAQVEEVLRQYKNHWPLSIRQIFYRLVGIYNYDKTELAYNRLCEYINRARRAKIIPFEAIRDDGWIKKEPYCFYDKGHFLRNMQYQVDDYTIDKQARQECQVFLLCEAGGMVPQLVKVAEPYSVPVMSSGGFDSLTVKYDLRRMIERKAIFLHVGDYDPSGVCIFDSLAADVTAFATGNIKEMDGFVTFDRLALTPEQIQLHNLPTAPAKKTDIRGNNVKQSCQLEALPPDILADIVEKAITDLYDMAVYEEDCRREVRERQELIDLFKSI
jgi:hypothetical protein